MNKLKMIACLKVIEIVSENYNPLVLVRAIDKRAHLDFEKINEIIEKSGSKNRKTAISRKTENLFCHFSGNQRSIAWVG